MLAFPGESRKLPDQDLLEGCVGLGGLVQHLAELGSVRDAARLCFVDVLAGHHVPVALGEVT